MRKFSASSNSSTSSTSFSLPTNPPNDPKLLIERANLYNSKYPIGILIKSAFGILNNARAYDNEGAREDAFILYSRFVDLVANQIANKPELKASKLKHKQDPRSKEGKMYQSFSELLSHLNVAMEKSEQIMDDLKKEYNAYKKLENSRQEIRELQKLKFNERKEREQKELLEKKNNFARRKSSVISDDNELLEKLRSLSNSSFKDFDHTPELEHLSYPSINEVAIADDDNNNNILTPIPPKLPSYSSIRERPPSFNKPSTNSALNGLSYKKSQIKSNQEINHKTVNFTEGGAPLRTIFLPADLSEIFKKIAEPNTVKKLETCGILIGKLNRNAFFITHLLIPEQDSTTDTCSTKNEEKMFEYIEEEDPDLFILGWIHTHPTQSCFLSSVDLHTQNSYQIMLNEAIAIVCSPNEKFTKNLGVFRLTDPPGVPTITNCNQIGFHPHEEPNLYVECNRVSNKQALSGHVVIRPELPFKIKDLRE